MTGLLNADRQRSASLTSLHALYKSQGRPPRSYDTLPSHQRRPLRVINDNATLLRSPGPLESMLKTTTETGDIGPFTIKPSIPPATYHAGQRSRPLLDDAQVLHTSRFKTLLKESNLDDRRRLPSHRRDTISDIVSLYGSDSQPSSPSLSKYDRSDFPFLTTISSKQVSHHNRVSSLSKPPSLISPQRSRSPSAHQKKLRSSGVRPTSPALMNSGSEDYSRMVELDRIYQGSPKQYYRSDYDSEHGRPTYRTETSRSTPASLPSKGSLAQFFMTHSPYCFHTPGSYRTDTPRSLDSGFLAPYDHTMASNSLTSLIDMYHQPATHSHRTLTHPTRSFYYDYSEDFEPNASPAQQVPTLCPIPQKTGSLRRPLVLRVEEEENLTNTVPKGHYKQGVGDLEGWRDSIASEKDECQALSSGPFSGSLSKEHESAYQHTSKHVTALMECSGEEYTLVRPAQSPRLMDENRSVLLPYNVNSNDSQQIHKEMPPVPDCVDAMSVNYGMYKDEHCGLIEVIAAYDGHSEDNHLSKIIGVRGEELEPSANQEPVIVAPTFRCLVESPSPQSSKVSPTLTANNAHNAGADDTSTWQGWAPERSAYLKRHRRNPAALRISSTNLKPSAINQTQGSTEDIPMLSSDPVYPTRQLGVRRSIPQLMQTVSRQSNYDGESQDHTRHSEVGTPVAVQGSEWLPEQADTYLWSKGRAVMEVVEHLPLAPSPHTRSGGKKFKLKVRKSESRDLRSGLGIPNRADSISDCASLRASSGRKRFQIKRNANQRGSHETTKPKFPLLKPATSFASPGQDRLVYSVPESEVTGPIFAPTATDYIAGPCPPFSASNSEFFTVKKDCSLPSDTSQRPMKHHASFSVLSKAEDGTLDVSTAQGGLRHMISISRLFTKDKRRAELSSRQPRPTPSICSDKREASVSVCRDRTRISLTKMPSRTTLSSMRLKPEGRLKRLTKNAKRLIRRCMKRKERHPSIVER